jgi:hypothetical protein
LNAQRTARRVSAANNAQHVAPRFVIPAQAGIQGMRQQWWLWIPACAGMTSIVNLGRRYSALDVDIQP